MIPASPCPSQSARFFVRIARTARMAVGSLALFVLSMVIASSSGCASVSGTHRPKTSPPQPYTRVLSPDSNSVSLQIALRKFVPGTGRGPAIWLSGVSHIGESNYYARLQRHLDAQSLVLFEGVGARNRSPRFDPAEQSSIQHTLATSLGLVFQLTAINYERPNFRNSDLTVPELERLLANDATPVSPDDDPNGGAKENSGASESSPEFRELLGVMNGTSTLGLLVNLGVRFLGTSPKLKAMMKLAMIETLGRFQGDLSEVKSVPPEMQRLMSVIIHGRNDVVMRDLRRQLTHAGPGQTISIFYGAGHMADLEKRLTGELGYRQREEIWATALSVDFQSSGLTPAELQSVRSLVQWQLDSLNSK